MLKHLSEIEKHQLQNEYMAGCSKCGGEGYIREVIKKGKVNYVKCACLIQYENAYNQIRANVPLNFVNLSLSILDKDFKEANKIGLGKLDNYGRKLKWAINKGAGLYIYGPNSAGKSFLGVSILKKALNEGYSIYFTLLEQLITNAINYSKHPHLYEKFTHFMKTVDFLMIDEVDKMESDRPASILSLFSFLLKERYNTKKPLIVTANMEKEDFINDEFINGGRAIFEEKLIKVFIEGNHRQKILNDLEEDLIK